MTVPRADGRPDLGALEEAHAAEVGQYQRLAEQLSAENKRFRETQQQQQQQLQQQQQHEQSPNHRQHDDRQHEQQQQLRADVASLRKQLEAERRALAQVKDTYGSLL